MENIEKKPEKALKITIECNGEVFEYSADHAMVLTPGATDEIAIKTPIEEANLLALGLSDVVKKYAKAAGISTEESLKLFSKDIVAKAHLILRVEKGNKLEN